MLWRLQLKRAPAHSDPTSGILHLFQKSSPWPRKAFLRGTPAFDIRPSSSVESKQKVWHEWLKNFVWSTFSRSKAFDNWEKAKLFCQISLHTITNDQNTQKTHLQVTIHETTQVLNKFACSQEFLASTVLVTCFCDENLRPTGLFYFVTQTSYFEIYLKRHKEKKMYTLSSRNMKSKTWIANTFNTPGPTTTNTIQKF